MFSSSVNGVPQSATSRTKRGRPRPSSAASDSISQPKAKRQRSALNESTFNSPDTTIEAQGVKTTKSAALEVARRESARLSEPQRRELTVRGKKSKPAERPNKGDGSIILTTNDTYTVSRLLSWPDRLQADSKARQHGAIYSESGYALSISLTHAIVWPYAVNHLSPETFTFALPHPSKSTHDALPLGSLVSPSASSSEPGLVIVATAGRVTYWESVASAATLDLIQQQRHGVDFQIPGMLSSESVIQVLNAEAAGFVLGFSSGRIAYMSVRDGQGRPAVSVQFLRGSGGAVGGGIFGSLRNVLSSAALRGDLAAARAGPSSRPGERTVLTATTKGRLQIWDLHRGGHNALQADAEAREQIVLAFKETNDRLSGLLIETFEVLDAVFAPRSFLPDSNGMEITEAGTPLLLLLLISMGAKDAAHYALIHVKVSSDSCEVGMVRHIKSYTTPLNRNATCKPRLRLPGPALVAFVILDRAVIVVSMAQQTPTPESQLLGESHIIPDHYEDVVDFRKDSGVEIVGSGEEQPHEAVHNLEDTKSRRHRSKHAAALLLVRGGGIIRVAATDPKRLHSNNPQIVTAKSKLEQAVFFGGQDNNPLNFRGRPEVKFSADEMATAAIDLSMEIISSTTPFIPSLPASLEQNLAQRGKALRALALHLKTIEAPLDRRTRWSLLSIAEKVHSASKVWAQYDAQLQTKPIGQKRGLFDDIVLSIHEQYKTEPVPSAGELDRVRHYFIKDIYRFDLAIPWAFQVLKLHYQHGEKDQATVMALLSEADDFVITALGAAYTFREESLLLYGLQDERLENGVLTSNLKNLPEFWTSTKFIVENLTKQSALARPLVMSHWPKQPVSTRGDPSAQLVEKARLEVPKLVDLCTTTATERYTWQMAQEDPSTVEKGEQGEETSLSLREEQIKDVADLNLIEEAIAVSVKHKIYNSLAFLLIEELVHANSQIDESIPGTEEFKAATRQSSRVEHRLQDFITQFGSEFAVSLYTYYLKRGELYDLIMDTTGKNAYLTEFLRSHPDLRPLAWINEVAVTKDFDRASKALLGLAHNTEEDVWCKKVELSLGKLARMAGRQYSQSNGLIIPDGGNTDLEPTNKQLALLTIQNQIYLKVLPHIKAAIDETAELDVTNEIFGIKDLDRPGKKIFPALVKDKLCKLVRHKAMDAVELIDLLTLMNTHRSSDQGGLLDDQEFYMALQVLQSAPEDWDEKDLTEKLIWRRCLLRDDWKAINDTDLRGDGEVLYRLQRTALYATLRTCIKARLFEKPATLSPMVPTSLLGAATTSPGARFSSPSLEASTFPNALADMAAEDSLLQSYIETCQLEKWYMGVFDAAKHDVEEEVNGETENGAVMQEVATELEAIEKRIAEEGKRRAVARLKARPRYKPKAVTGASASSGAFRKSLRITG